MTEPSEYVLEPLWENVDFTLYRARQHGNSSPVLVVALAAEQPSLEDLRQLDYTGLSMEDWLGRGWRAVAHPGDLVRTAEKWQPALATRRAVRNVRSERELSPAPR
jgi:hypothetical protein